MDKAALAEAGKRKLEAFRNRKKKKKKDKRAGGGLAPEGGDAAQGTDPPARADVQRHEKQAEPAPPVPKEVRGADLGEASSLSHSYAMLSDAYVTPAPTPATPVAPARARDAGEASAAGVPMFRVSQGGIPFGGSGSDAFGSPVTSPPWQPPVPLPSQSTPVPPPPLEMGGEGGGEVPGVSDEELEERGVSEEDIVRRIQGDKQPHPSSGTVDGAPGPSSLALQDMIHTLTQDKYALTRGLEEQRQSVHRLSQQNAALAAELNARGTADAEAAGQLGSLRSHLELVAREREAAVNGAEAAKERAGALANEVIHLEEELLKTRSNELRADHSRVRAEERAEEALRKLDLLRMEREELLGRPGEGGVKQVAATNGEDAVGMQGWEGSNGGAPSSNGSHLPAPTPTLAHGAPPPADLVASLQKGVVDVGMVPLSEEEIPDVLREVLSRTNYQTAALVESVFTLLKLEAEDT